MNKWPEQPDKPLEGKDENAALLEGRLSIIWPVKE